MKPLIIALLALVVVACLYGGDRVVRSFRATVAARVVRVEQ